MKAGETTNPGPSMEDSRWLQLINFSFTHPSPNLKLICDSFHNEHFKTKQEGLAWLQGKMMILILIKLMKIMTFIDSIYFWALLHHYLIGCPFTQDIQSIEHVAIAILQLKKQRLQDIRWFAPRVTLISFLVHAAAGSVHKNLVKSTVACLSLLFVSEAAFLLQTTKAVQINSCGFHLKKKRNWTRK